MSYSNFNTFKLFENVGINSSNVYMLSMKPNGNNVSFHSSNSIDYNNVDIMSIKNIINKKQNEDLNLSSLTGTTINPVITINNNNQDCRIMTNLNVSGNLNIMGNGIVFTKTKSELSFPSPGTGSNQTHMGKLRFNNDDNCYIAGQYETTSNSVGNDLVFVFTGGDIRLFTNDTPNTRAGNYEALFFINPSYHFYIYGNQGNNNIILTNDSFTGTYSYSGGSSDDRLKHEEELIENATDTLMKLKPQIYMKDDKLPQSRHRKIPNKIIDNTDIITQKESGLIAQEVYYQAPELRHLVITRVENEEDIQELPENVDLNDIQNDPDWVGLGWNEYEPANIKYTELIPYLIKSNQEQQEEINTLKAENGELKSIIDKLKTANSFEDFKNNL